MPCNFESRAALVLAAAHHHGVWLIQLSGHQPEWRHPTAYLLDGDHRHALHYNDAMVQQRCVIPHLYL